MGVYEIEIQVDSDFANRIDAQALIRAARTTLTLEDQPDGTGLTVVITDDEQIRALNRQFNATDRPTDVLAFSGREGTDFVSPDEGGLYLGDIVLSYPTALAQATEHGHPVAEELALLTVHGCLHLLGYDHVTESEREHMWGRQEEILRRVL